MLDKYKAYAPDKDRRWDITHKAKGIRQSSMANQEPENRIPEDALERQQTYASGWKGTLDLRRKSIREATTQLLMPMAGVPPEAASVSSRLNQIGQAIVAHLWHLLAQLEQHERTVEHIHEELERTQERLSELPPFRYDEPKDIARARYGAEQLRSQLGHELRETHRRWLEARGEAETAIAELATQYSEVLSTIENHAGQSYPRPTLAHVLRFLSEPPAQDVIILAQAEPVDQDVAERIP